MGTLNDDMLRSRGITHLGGKSYSAKCGTCGKVKHLFLRDVLRTKSNYCSKKCSVAGLRTNPPKKCKVCGIDFWATKGFKRYSTCDSDGCRRMGKSGDNNPNWRGGRTTGRKSEMSKKEYKQWRAAVFTRDDYTCQMCYARGGDLNADHILPWAHYPKLRYELDNGRTLCLACHKTTYKEVHQHRSRVSDMSKSVLAVDFDGTLCNSSPPDFLLGNPIVRNVEMLRKCVLLGYKIFIHTARHWSDYGEIQEWLENHDIPYDAIICGKILAYKYIDDRNIDINKDWINQL